MVIFQDQPSPTEFVGIDIVPRRSRTWVGTNGRAGWEKINVRDFCGGSLVVGGGEGYHNAVRVLHIAWFAVNNGITLRWKNLIFKPSLTLNTQCYITLHNGKGTTGRAERKIGNGAGGTR